MEEGKWHLKTQVTMSQVSQRHTDATRWPRAITAQDRTKESLKRCRVVFLYQGGSNFLPHKNFPFLLYDCERIQTFYSRCCYSRILLTCHINGAQRLNAKTREWYRVNFNLASPYHYVNHLVTVHTDQFLFGYIHKQPHHLTQPSMTNDCLGREKLY